MDVGFAVAFMHWHCAQFNNQPCTTPHWCTNTFRLMNGLDVLDPEIDELYVITGYEPRSNRVPSP